MRKCKLKIPESKKEKQVGGILECPKNFGNPKNTEIFKGIQNVVDQKNHSSWGGSR